MALASTAMPPARIQAGTREFRQTRRAMFLGGFSTFALLYCVQPLLPLFADEFALSPMHSSWALSASTGTLAVCLLLASVASDRLGRTNIMCLALLLSALLNAASALSHSFTQLLALRALLGMTLAGVPAVALASSLYLFFYYLGSSLIGSFSGFMWETSGWGGVVAVLAMCLALSLLVAVRLRKLAPLSA